MATSSTQNVVNPSLSVGDSPVDVHGDQPLATSAASGSDPSFISQALPEHALSDSHLLNGDSSVSLNRKSDNATSEGSGLSMPNGVGAENEGELEQEAREKTEDGNVGTDGVEDRDHLDQGIYSDTDTSRADSTDQARDAQGQHLRSASVKKATTFKSVSVTKNFLAKTATVAPSIKAGDKIVASTPTPPIAKPRLVAKSGSGLRDTPRVRPATEGSSDGATVWNRNRPAPAPPPKQWTDEELKQQYGIHLATRLQTDEAGEKSKWADMEDEEDDWAPETLEWMDGTKSSIVPTESSPAPVEAAKTAEKPEEVPPPQTKPTLTALKRPSATGPPKTILRPGAAQQVKQEGPERNGTPEQKASLVVKAPAPVPVKSPWAQLPPQKVAPIFEPPPAPQQQHAPSFGQPDVHGFSGMPAPTREIEADTFDRSWRENDRGTRELFNSQSGRYEPAPANRRSSMRQEQGFRQPALLHRPSQNDVLSPAEPSSAFQTRSSAQVDGSPWSRRRGSSFSGSAVSVERKQSITKPPVIPSPQAEARTGIVIGHDLGRQAPKAESSHAQRIAQEQADRAEELARQKKIMQEKRDLAIRRRQEEEQREEAARKERIRLKMESLGMPPLAAKESGKDSERPPADAVEQKSVEDEKVAPAPLSKVPTDEFAKPAEAPTSHAPQQDVQASPEAQSQPLKAGHSDPGPQPTAKVQPSVTPLPPPIEAQQSPRGPLMTQATAIPSAVSSPGEQKTQLGHKSPALGADSFATWGPGVNPRTTSSGNVWGPPTTSRHIGNGAFDANYSSRIAPRLHQQQHGPMSTVSSFQNQNRAVSQPFPPRQDTSPMMHQQLLSDQNLAALGLADDIPNDRLAAPISTGTSPPSNQAVPYALSPIAPPQRVNNLNQNQPPPAQRGVAAWGQFAVKAQADHEQAEKDAAIRRSQATNEPQLPVATQQRWKETFKQTKITHDWHGGPREILATEKTVRGGQPQSSLPTKPSPAPPSAQTQQPTAQVLLGEPTQVAKESTVRLPTGPSSFAQGTLHGVAPKSAQQGRTVSAPHNMGHHHSRFFPSPIHEEATYEDTPPPEESSHPAFAGDSGRPLVNLPAPKPQVRLPPGPLPRGAAAQHAPVIMPQRYASHSGIQPLVKSSDWQARFNGLLGKVVTTVAAPPSPPRTPPKADVPAAAIMAESKADLFDLSDAAPFTVSLPYSGTTAPATGQDAVTKPMVDDIFDGELSFGSTPKVFVPRNATYASAFVGRRPHILHMRPHAKFDKPVDPSSKVAWSTIEEEPGRPSAIIIKLSDQPAKEVALKPRSKGPARKTSAKPNKPKRVESTTGKSSPSLNASSTVNPSSRNPSFQKNAPSGAPSSPRPAPGGSPQKDLSSAPTPGSTPKPLKYNKGRKASAKVQASA